MLAGDLHFLNKRLWMEKELDGRKGDALHHFLSILSIITE